MTAFRDAMKEMKNLPELKLGLRASPRIATVAESIEEPTVKVESPRANLNYDLIASELKVRIARNERLTWRDLREATWCLWGTDPQLAVLPEPLAIILEGISQQENRKPYRALASTYIGSFDIELPGLSSVAKKLSAGAEKRGRPWSNLQRDFDVFDPTSGPASVARAAITGYTSPTEILKAGGLSILDAQSGFAKFSTSTALRLLAEGLMPDHERRVTLIQKLTLDARGQLIFRDYGHLVAAALVAPFRDHMPEKALRDLVLSVVLSLFGDPRLEPGRWARMRETESTIRRWLTEQSLRQFLDVVDKVADKKMWRYRRAFWEAVYNEGLVSEAWVVFGTDGERTAKRVFGEKTSFGTFTRVGAKPVEKGHAVLLLRIGNGVVADWSHLGRCCIWSNFEDKGAPKLYQPRYNSNNVDISGGLSDDVHSATFNIAHTASENYNWQNKVSQKIHQMTGARVSQAKYAVAR